MVTKKKTLAPPPAQASGVPLGGAQSTTPHPWTKDRIPDEVFAAAERQGGRVRVRATRMGWYDTSRRRPGDVFVLLAPEHFGTSWMELVPDNVPLQRTLGKTALAQEHADIMRGRSPRLQANAADLEPDDSREGATVYPPDPESPLE